MMNRKHPGISGIKGLSLIELMVAMVIVTILLLGVTTVYFASKRSYRLNDEYAEIQENARFLFSNVVKDLRMAGYSGCDSIRDMAINGINVISATAIPGLPAFANGNFITGHNGAINNWPSTGMAKPGNIAAGTDAITTIRASACSDTLTKPAAPGGTISATNSCNFQPNDTVLITDCVNTEVFTISSINGLGELVHATPENVQSNLQNEFGAGSIIFKPTRSTYYIGTDPGTGDLGLYRIQYTAAGGVFGLSAPSVLIPNVENMVIAYGVDTTDNGSADTFASADQVGNLALQGDVAAGQTPWSRVVSMDIRFLTASDNIGNPNAQVNGYAYTFNNNYVPSSAVTDNRLRREFITGINLRNNTP